MTGSQFKTPGSSTEKQPTIYPLSLAQQQVWLDQQLHPDSPHLTTGGLGFINGPLEIPLFEQTVAQMVADNDALRLLPLADGSQMLVERWDEVLLEYHDVSECDDSEQAIVNWWQNTHPSPIPLDGIHKPWHIYLVKSTESRYCIAMKYHHIMIDGFSTALAMNTMSVIYTELARKQHNITTDPLPLPSIYADGQTSYLQYIEESNSYLQSKALEQDRKYWRGLFPSLPAPLLEKRRYRVDIASDRLPLAHNHYHHIAADDYQGFRDFSKQLKATTYHLFIAAVSIYFARIYNKQQVVIGVPVLNRGGKRYKSTLGMFVVIMPLKITIEPDATTESIVAQIVASLRSSYRHSRYAASMLGQDLDMVRQGQDRFFDITFSFEATNYHAHYVDAPTSEPRHTFGDHARYPLSIAICEFHDNEPVEMVLSGHEAYFSHDETIALGRNLQYLVGQMQAAPDMIYRQLSLSPIDDCMLKSSPSQTTQRQEPDTIVALFEKQASLQPEAVAIRWMDSGYMLTLSYQRLNQQANRLARHLQQEGVKAGSVVAVALPRQSETIAAYIAIAKLGAAFLPLDPEQPVERLEQQLASSEAILLICPAALDVADKSLNIKRLDLTELQDCLNDSTLADDNLAYQSKSNDLAYVLYTSGTTGTPKGVAVEHVALAHRLAWLADIFAYTSDDIALQSIQLTFDPALLEIFLPLTTGASVALAAQGKVLPQDLPRLASEFGATSMIFVPTTLAYFNQRVAEYPDLKLRVAISGGEALSQELATEFVRATGACLYNLYGPTEACIFACAHLADPNAKADWVPIGQPVAGSEISILDACQRPLPRGCMGEIAIGGAGLARGYINNTAMTTERFVEGTFAQGQKLYRTGDIGFIDDKGQLQFVGRNDEQIKLRGQRIEPQEIEMRLAEQADVVAAAVKAIDNNLHAWLVMDKPLTPDAIAEIKAALQSKLPAYMIPVFFHPLDALPRQSSGKTDYASLQPSATALDLANKAPLSSSLEATLLAICQRVLNNPGIDAHSHLFDHGADSLASLRLISEIRSKTGKNVPFPLLLQNPTVASLAVVLQQLRPPTLVNLRFNKDKPTIFLAASGHGDSLRFEHLAKALGAEYSIFMLQPPSQTGDGKANFAFKRIAEHYADLIQQHHAGQPVVLAGFSIGGISALETARMLCDRASIKPDKLILIDTAFPMLRRLLPKAWRAASFVINKLGWQQRTIANRPLGSWFNDQGLSEQVYALSSYQLKPVELSTTLIQSSKLARWRFFLFKPWQSLLGEVLTIETVAGDHRSMFRSQHIGELAKMVKKAVAG
tara:strand:- start:4008 stop:7922 length:3915 start_codon:yes stop_codon:yes gene_type:complete